MVSMFLPSSTVMTPSLPTFSKASAMMRPIAASLLAEIVATFWMSPLPLTGVERSLISDAATSTAAFMPRTSALASTPAAM